MVEEKNKSLINDDEFQFLSELNANTEEPDGSEKKLEYDISSTNSQDGLLFQLAVADGLQLVANYENHHLVFPVQMKVGDFSNFSMSIKSPKIFENGEQLRSWRLLADKTISLVNEQGKALHYQVKDLSASGISLLIDNKEGGDFPELLNNIYLQLPNRKRLAISGAQIRRVDNKTVAYSLGESNDDSSLAALTEYLFECHADQYPEAHAEQFKYPVSFEHQKDK